MKLRVSDRLDAAELDAVLRIIERATAADDASPVSEESLLHLRAPVLGHRVRHVTATLEDRVVGYGALHPTDGPVPWTAELAVDPAFRSRGAGRVIVERMLAESAGGGLALWAHGRRSDSAGLAHALGFDKQRTLLHMRRSLTGRLPQRPMPDQIALRTFIRGRDEEALLALNARAFSWLPDQGSWTERDLVARMLEPWFDPEGIFLAEEDGRLAGFHWTKLHPPQPLGEVYVLAVDERFAGRGIGSALLLHGLRSMRARGATTAMLYVTESNSPAVRLYQRLGFTVWDTDVLYVRG